MREKFVPHNLHNEEKTDIWMSVKILQNSSW